MSDDNKPDIWQLQSQFDIQGLVTALSSDDAAIRRRAAAALRAIGANEALASLRSAFAAEEDPQTRHTIATAIEMLTAEPSAQNAPEPEKPPTEPVIHEAMVKRLIEKLKTGKPDEVIEVAHRLGEMGDKIAVEPLVLIFNDSRQSIQVRLAVAEALLKLESAPVEVALLANLRHTDWHIRRNGAAILGQLRAEWAIQPLARALKDPHPVVSRTARAALKHIGTPESRKALAQGSVESTRRANVNIDNSEGLEIKRVGGHHEVEQPSRMLRRLDGPPDSHRTSTRPLDSKVADEAAARRKPAEETMPMGFSAFDRALAEVAAEVEAAAEKDNPITMPGKTATSEVPAVSADTPSPDEPAPDQTED